MNGEILAEKLDRINDTLDDIHQESCNILVEANQITGYLKHIVSGIFFIVSVISIAIIWIIGAL